MTKELAPIALFAYNRPIHTQKVLDALACNIGAIESDLFIFCDGVKDGVSEKDLLKVQVVENIARNENRFKSVQVFKSEFNKGLANSIIGGVSKILETHDNIIVLEDDIVPEKGFLKYMNEALHFYKDHAQVGCIHAWNFSFENNNYPHQTFFLKGSDCWGWATWKSSWKLFNPDATYLLQEIKSENLTYSFDRNGTTAYTKMLEEQSLGNIDSWAIRWHASLFLHNQYCLHPTKPIVTNIGLDNSGIHSGSVEISQKTVQEITIEPIAVEEPKWFFDSLIQYQKRPSFLKKVQSKINKKIAKWKNPRKPVWSGDYSSWKEAQQITEGYDADEILEKCLQSVLKVKKGLAVYERDSFIFDEIEYSEDLLKCLETVYTQNNNSLTVLDFGGSLGSTYFQNKYRLSHLKHLDWNIVEQEQFVKAGNDFVAGEQLHFYYSIKECLSAKKVDVILLSSVLQYIEQYQQLLQEINVHQIPYIILDRTSIVNYKRPIITVQVVPEEIYKASYPCWFFNKNEVVSQLSKYETVFEFKSFCENDIKLNKKHKASWLGMLMRLKS